MSIPHTCPHCLPGDLQGGLLAWRYWYQTHTVLVKHRRKKSGRSRIKKRVEQTQREEDEERGREGRKERRKEANLEEEKIAETFNVGRLCYGGMNVCMFENKAKRKGNRSRNIIKSVNLWRHEITLCHPSLTLNNLPAVNQYSCDCQPARIFYLCHLLRFVYTEKWKEAAWLDRHRS